MGSISAPLAKTKQLVAVFAVFLTTQRSFIVLIFNILLIVYVLEEIRYLHFTYLDQILDFVNQFNKLKTHFHDKLVKM